ncbi:HTH_Tnp_Tc3_2 domain-containing protein [Trichonephila clavipes]|nr:HTH_Tnp_Tc3_2 domain-containing protein [Trichonephila clavipes]
MEDSERWRAVGRIEAGQSIKDVALFLGVHHSVMSRLWKQFQTTQTVVRRPVGGCPKVTTPAEDRYIATVAKRNRRATSTRVTSMVTASIGKAISGATVHRRLHMNGLYAKVPRVCIPLSVQSRGARLKWCREHCDWTVSDWGNVMFTDESRFTLEPDGKRIRIWRK